MADIKAKIIASGRKFYVVKVLIVMWITNFSGIMYLAIAKFDVPQSLGVSLGTVTAGIVSYIGFNVLQKKIQTPVPGGADE
jgi:hypothetical protein